MPVLCNADDIYCGNTTPELTLFAPLIKSIGLNPNPVNQNTSLLITVNVIEKDTVVPSAVIVYSGTFNCNQEII